MPTTHPSVWRSLWRHSTALDRLTVGYILAYAAALAVRGRDFGAWPLLFSAHLAVAILIVAIIWRWHDSANDVARFIRHLYPALLYPLLYREMQIANFWVFPGFLDERVVELERALFGVDPNIWIMSAQSGWSNEIMMLGYFSYYLIIPVVALPLFFHRRFDELHAMLLGTTTAFVISYVGFALCPVEGPRYYFADQLSRPLDGWLFVPLVSYIIDTAAIRGGCMPSSHVAVALVALFWARRTMPRLGLALTPFVLILIFSTAWGRFHYISDAIAGTFVGLGALFLTGFWAKEEARQSLSTQTVRTVMETAQSR